MARAYKVGKVALQAGAANEFDIAGVEGEPSKCSVFACVTDAEGKGLPSKKSDFELSAVDDTTWRLKYVPAEAVDGTLHFALLMKGKLKAGPGGKPVKSGRERLQPPGITGTPGATLRIECRKTHCTLLTRSKVAVSSSVKPVDGAFTLTSPDEGSVEAKLAYVIVGNSKFSEDIKLD